MVARETSFFWHDYETFGIDPQRDRPCQFAGVRTDYDFNIIGEPIRLYCKPADDCLPHPEACLITGITPQDAQLKGICEADFIKVIHAHLAQPNTCALGFNTIRFDDEVTRNLLYRNFYDPYAREWQNNNSRWDLIDVVRATCALRPDGIVWSTNEEGIPVLRLEELTRVNGIEHLGAHDALSDVYATIELAKLIKKRQPKLYDFLFANRTKSHALALLKLGEYRPVVHVSGRYPNRSYCTAIVLPICMHPNNDNGVIVYDLSVDPRPMLELSVEEIKSRVFTAGESLPVNVERIPLKTVHINKCPVLAPISVIRQIDAERLGLDLSRCFLHLESIKSAVGLADKLAEVFVTRFDRTISDPDLMIYSGGFFNRHDKMQMNRIVYAKPEQLSAQRFEFEDGRLEEMLFRYRGRNFSEMLTDEERRRWDAFCVQALCGDRIGSGQTLKSYLEKVALLKKMPDAKLALLEELEIFGLTKASKFSILLD